ncbi:MAG: hypothetical protein M1820_007595 [Bogoriella megaspora]|nr:MAG: hypothetical protein M1820_007595 [Bogoriella megaspora]
MATWTSYGEQAAANAQPVWDSFPVYNDFPWEEIEAFLQEKWPHFKDHKHRMENDTFIFQVPKKLTLTDQLALKERKNEKQRQLRDTETDEEC